MSEEMELPESWSSDKIGNVFFTTSGGTPSRKNPNYYIGSIPWVKSGELDKGLITQTEEYISTEAIENSSAKVFPKGTLLIALYGATIGKLGFLGVDAATNQAICGIFDNGNFSLQYTKYFLFHNRNKLIEQGAGGAQPNISQTILKELSIVIPPLAEQHRIVAKIEELFSSLDKAIERINTAKEQLKVYRQAVLKWAFEGRFTNDNVKDGELPKGWEWVTFDDVSIKIGDIDHKMPKEIEGHGIPYVSTKDFTDDFKISFAKAKHISEDDYVLLSKKIKPERGDIIFPRYGTIGKNILIDFDKVFLVSYSCAIIKLNKAKIEPRYAYYYSLSPTIKDEIKKYTVETTQANVGIASIKKFVFPLPKNGQEQLDVVSEIESRLSVCDKIEEGIENSLLQAEALRQSILKRAFEGKLVPQDPNDEPASKLIERIKAEREQNGGIRVKKEKKTRVMKEHKME